jgi:hypothetical protein
VAQLNKAAADLPSSMMARWVAWIRLFSFEVRHVPRAKHVVADALLRKLRTESDTIDD